MITRTIIRITKPCLFCGRDIPKGHQCVALYNAETGKDIRIGFAHFSCAKKAAENG